jgi:hypothetical protein
MTIANIDEGKERATGLRLNDRMDVCRPERGDRVQNCGHITNREGPALRL